MRVCRRRREARCLVQSAGGAFSGAARTLAAGDAPAAPAQPEGEPEAAAPASIVHTITFYADGQFTVDDGALLFAFINYFLLMK